jgi:tetratricopeptide (TPR) repeat protein
MKIFPITFKLQRGYICAICALFILVPIRSAGLEAYPNFLLNSVDHPLVVQATKAFTEGRFQESAALLSNALKIYPTTGSIYNLRGMAYEMMNQDQKAVEDYRKTLEIDPDNYEAMENLAAIYENKGGPVPEAIELYKRALALDPRPAWKSALPVWIAILETRLRPETATAVGCWNLANGLATNGKTKQAESLYSRAIKLNPNLYQAYFGRGLIKLKTGDLKGALADFERTGSMAPSSRGWLAHRGIVYKRMGDREKALEDFRQAIVLDPTDPLAFYELGTLLEEEKEFEAASELYQKALKLRPNPSLRKLIEKNKFKRESRIGDFSFLNVDIVCLNSD